MKRNTDADSPHSDPPQYLNQPQVAALLPISESFLKKARVRGDGPPYIKVGRRVLYNRHDLDAWLASHVRTSTSAGAE
jgi:predicted DNA-binding transcriptional regulator AlpA